MILNKYHICCLQDTHFIDLDRETLRKEWGGQCFFSCKASNSRGVAILFSRDITVDILDSKGNVVILHIRIFDYDITLLSLYGPNTDSPFFMIS